MAKHTLKIFHPEFICDVLHDLVPFVQFKKEESYSWRSYSELKAQKYIVLIDSVCHCLGDEN